MCFTKVQWHHNVKTKVLRIISYQISKWWKFKISCVKLHKILWTKMEIFIDEQIVANVIVSLKMPYVLKSIGKQPSYDYIIQ